MKSVLNGTHFPSVEEAKAKTAQLLNGLGVEEVYHCFEQWRTRMQRCVDKEGGYIEGDNSQIVKFCELTRFLPPVSFLNCRTSYII